MLDVYFGGGGDDQQIPWHEKNKPLEIIIYEFLSEITTWQGNRKRATT